MKGSAPIQESLLGRLQRCLNEPQHTRRLWLGNLSVWVAGLGLLLALVSPPQGSGLTVCWLRAATGLPCPGCGLTRSLSCGIRGLWLDSWNHHPMGLVILALFVVTVAQGLLPRPWREGLAAWLERRAFLCNTLYFVFVAAFVGFGAARALLCLALQARWHAV